MASGYPNLVKQLAVAVRSIQWSYAIFWSTSATEQRSLEWGDGYYNGDIKTRKTIQSVEMNADQMSLQRSEQLRELYLSLSASETKSNLQANRRPSAALSPEDLTDAEWYYLVCMSFVFDFGEGLPGRVLANGQPIWLCNAHYADSKVFSRSLLAKSASIQSVVCFPFLQGVIELGATDLVLEDPGLIQHIKTTFLENPYPLISDMTSNMASTMRNEHIVDTTMVPVLGCEDVLEMSSPSNSSNNNGFDAGLPALPEDSSMFELSNCVHHSMDSTDCISEAFADPVNIENKPIDAKFTSLDLSSNDTHYQNILLDLLKTSDQLIMGPRFQNCNRKSSFLSCKKVGFTNICCQKQREGIAQKLLKKILFEVPRMYSEKNNNNNNTDDLFELSKENATDDDVWKLVADDVVSNRVPVEKLNERFLILESLVPSISKVDKISILDDTIEYILELEKKVEELESFRELSESEATRTKQKPKDIAERTSDNYGSNKVMSFRRKPLVYKRKANCAIHEIMEPIDENDHIYEDNTFSVGIKDKDVLIEFKCPWREGILVEIMDTVSNLRLDAHSVQSSTTDGILSLRIKSKYKGPIIASADMIKQSLRKMVWKS